MKRCLIMITTSFPFKSGEPYLETELPYLAKSFDKILLFTIGLDKGISSCLTFPSNVTAFNPSKGNAKKEKIKDVIKGLPFVLHFPKKFKSEKTETGLSLSKRVFSGYLIARSKRHRDEIFALIRDFDFSEFDEVKIYGYWFFAAAATAVLLKEKLSASGAPQILTFSRAHSYDVYEYANKLNFLPLRNFLLKNLDFVFACSENGREHIVSKYPEYKEKVSVSYLGTEGGELTEGSDDGVFRILTCSRTVPLKRLDRLVSVLSLLRGENISLSWTHIGDGPSLESIKTSAKEKLSFMSVTFKGEMSHTSVIDYIKSNKTDLFINISEREGLPVSVMEAVSFSIPSVVTDVGGCREIITDGFNGFLLSKDFWDEQLADIIVSCAKDGKLRDMRQNAYSSWEKKFKATNNYRDFSQFICSK